MNAEDKQEKKGLWQRCQEKLRGQPISDEDLLKYTGKTRAEFDTFKETTPGVGRNQLAGTLAMGSAPGLGGTAAAYGVGGWGPGAAPEGEDRGMKFPPGRHDQVVEAKAEAKRKAIEEQSD
ncbi:hypothetical protein IF1G_08429 [Cordyceps javanica]|uniref:Uncharacterized protein n=1 Tax=Cordyceps javanica TaxID=43265 RepID=A0A545UUJ1_9HYPO|nr:hypothetical protein IF1G_08429 [Cordyceps javanica]TQW05026.1 hypothetical protein IF2G_07669 [Cordyceps javanica]